MKLIINGILNLRIVLIFSLILGIGSTFDLYSQAPVFQIDECPSETFTEYQNEEIKVPESNSCCNSSGEIRYVAGGDVDIADITLKRLDATPGPHRVKVEVDWVAGAQGVVNIDVYGRARRKRGVFCNCYWTDWSILYTYQISKIGISPGGSLEGTSVYGSSSGDVNIAVVYHKNSSYNEDVNKVEFFIDGESLGIQERANDENTITLNHTVADFGSYTLSAQAQGSCGEWWDIPAKTVDVKPSCFEDDPNEISFELFGPGLTIYEEGTELTANNQYDVAISGVTDFDSHYDLGHDGGADIELEEKKLSVNSLLGSYRLEATRKEQRGECVSIPAINLFVGGRDLTIDENCLVTLPEGLADYGFDVTPGEPALSHFAANITSRKGFVIKPGVTLSMGAELILEYTEPTIDDSELDPNMNFIESTAYDDFGRVILQDRRYFDKQGRITQSQIKNLEDDVIIATQVVNDLYGRPVLTTLPAPSKAGTFEQVQDGCGDLVQAGSYVKFEYASNFINGNGNDPYDYKQFDLNPTGRINNEQTPAPVENDEEGTLGWYYSANNGTASGENAKINESLVAQTAYPYTRTLFHDDGTQNIKSVARPGEVFRAGTENIAVTDNISVDNNDPYLADYFSIREDELGLSYPDNLIKSENFFKNTTTDEMGATSVSYQDVSGNNIISLYLGNQSTAITRNYQFYDDLDRLAISISPNGWEQYNTGTSFELIDKTKYIYDFRGRLMTSIAPDAGKTEFIYRKDGNIRFSQNDEQSKNRSFSYTNYDRLGRPIESGELILSYAFDFRDLLIPQSEKLSELWVDEIDMNAIRKDWIKSYYDQVDYRFSEETGLSDLSQRFVQGVISFTQNESVKTWFSYDERSRVEWMVQKIDGLGVKLVEYTYDASGEVQLVAYQRGELDEFYHFYEYDKSGRLFKVYTAISEPIYNLMGEIENPEVLQQQALYNYYLHGPLKRIELADQLQGIDFVYTIGGALKSINDADAIKDPGKDGLGDGEFKPDVFGMTLDYYNGDHQRGTSVNDGIEQFTGNIKAQSWFSPVDGGIQRGYVYDYDSRYQLSAATFGNKTGAGFVPSLDSYKMNVLGGYDANGNIQGLTRNDKNGTALHNLKYNYEVNKNQLTSVTQAGDAFKSYRYNDIGQLTLESNDEDVLAMEYDVTGKVRNIYSDINKTINLASYNYDDRGFRISKTIFDDNGTEKQRTWYIRDASGQLLSLYEEDLSSGLLAEQKELPIYGLGRVGLYRPTANWSKYLYQLSDHLGNVRAVIGEPVTLEYLATMESEREQDERIDFEGQFDNWQSTPALDMINHTNNNITVDDIDLTIDNPNEVIRLNGYRNISQGAGIMLPVSAGDKLEIEVYVKYLDLREDEGIGAGPLLAYLFSGLGNFNQTLVEGGGVRIVDNNSNLSALFGTSSTAGLPEAYLNYQFFDEHNTAVEGGFQFVRVSSVAEIDPLDLGRPHEKLILEVEVQQSGFAYVNVSHDASENVDVYFDDLRISHTLSSVVSARDYFPFGLEMQSREINREKYRFGYQGEFAEKDEETGWNSFELRNYDPVIGRWLTVDPAGQFASPYLSMGNNPMSQIDRDGAFSTHTDENGNVVAVYDDNDLGIYKHTGDEISAWLENGGDLTGGELMGFTLHTFSFTYFEDLEDGVITPMGYIDFDSDWAKEAVNGVIWNIKGRGLIHYANNAGQGEKYDIKSFAAERYGSNYFGSRLYGNVYTSARDAGNFAAGMVQQNSILPNYLISLGFGAFNHAGDKLTGGLLVLEKLIIDPLPSNGIPLSPLQAPYYGEDMGSALGIQVGREYGRIHGFHYID